MADESDLLHDGTALISAMRRGLRRDVQAFIEHLDKVAVHVALSRPLPNVEVGTRQEMEEELTLAPHLLPLNDTWVVALFSDRDQAKTVGQYLGWTTEGATLDICSLPARVGFELALQLIDDQQVIGLVLNPGDETEVFLSRAEAASIAGGKAIPLVGYVQEIPPGADEHTLLAELDRSPPDELRMIIDDWIQRSAFESYELQQTFNPERDLEPHLTLRVRKGSASGDDRSALAPLLAELEGKLPPPGYIDVVFE